jgi:thioredoxin-related protein
LIVGFTQLKAQVWYTNCDSALNLSEKKQRPVLMVFSGSDWCSNCIIFKKTILDSELFISYAKDNLILLNIDFPRKKKNLQEPNMVAYNDKMAEKYNPRGYFPYVLLLDHSGDVAAVVDHQNDGAEAFIIQLQTISQ